STGERRRVDSQVAAEFDSRVKMLYRPLPQDLSTGGLMRHVLRMSSRDVRTVALAALGAALLAMAAPVGAALLIGSAVPAADTNVLWQVAMGMVAAAFGSTLLLLVQAAAILRGQGKAFVALQTGVWDRLLQLGTGFFRGFTAGQLRLRADSI